jgi:hypothetical protein
LFGRWSIRFGQEVVEESRGRGRQDGAKTVVLTVEWGGVKNVDLYWVVGGSVLVKKGERLNQVVCAGNRQCVVCE